MRIIRLVYELSVRNPEYRGGDDGKAVMSQAVLWQSIFVYKTLQLGL